MRVTRNEDPLRRWITRKIAEVGSQTAFAEETGVSQTLLSKFLHKTKSLGEESLAKIAEVYPEALPYVRQASKIPYHVNDIADYIAGVVRQLDQQDQFVALRVVMSLKQNQIGWSIEEYDAMAKLAETAPGLMQDILGNVSRQSPVHQDRLFDGNTVVAHLQNDDEGMPERTGEPIATR